MTNPNTSLIEVIARAIRDQQWLDNAGWTPTDADAPPEQWLKRAQAALNAIQSSGMVVVPVEPNDEMQDAGRVACFRLLFPQGTPFDEADCQAGAFAAYQAMLKAAPQPDVNGAAKS